MTTIVFLSGSRRIRHINDLIRSRIDNMIRQDFSVVIGDADGADKAMQEYLAERRYSKVIVYCSGNTCRNNIGRWEVRNIPVNHRPGSREFYVVKDVAMADQADFGFLVWDGKSAGTFGNLLELVKRGKKALVYYVADSSYHQVSSFQHAHQILLKSSTTTVMKIYKKLQLSTTWAVKNGEAEQLTLNI